MREFAVARGAATLRASELGDGPAAVFLHAGVADRRSWFGVMEIVADTGVRCIAYDQRGYGDTESPDEQFSHRDDLAAVLDDREVDRAVVIGASRGGQIALDFTLASPDRVSALMLVGSAPNDAPFPAPPDAVRALSEAIEQADDAGDLQKVNELEAQAWLDGPLAKPERVGSPLRDLFLDMTGRALGSAFSGEAVPFAPTWDRLPAMARPVSILVGDLDMPGLMAAAEATAQHIPKARFRILPETAHLPMLEQPAVVAEEVIALTRAAGVL